MSVADAAGNIVLGSASPFNAPLAWDSLILGGGIFIWNGRVDFHGAERPFDWQFKKPPGLKGNINTFRGQHTHPFWMHVLVWTDAQWALLPGLLNFFKYNTSTPGPDGNPLVGPIEIMHPALSFIDIYQVVCEAIAAPEIDKERTGWAWIKFKLHEYLPAIIVQNVTTTPLGPMATPFVNNTEVGLPAQILASQDQIGALSAQLGQTGSLP